MAGNLNRRFHEQVRSKGYSPAHVVEVGVWHPETSNIYQYIEEGVRATLVEPDPASIDLIKASFGGKSNVTLHEVAVCDFDGEVDLVKRASSTFVSSLASSPALVNDDFDIDSAEKFTATAQRFRSIDDGTIDLLSVDTEGSEWFVIKDMSSRPAVISIETHGGTYVNPYLRQILDWMAEHGYVLWYRDKSDSVFVLPDMIPVTAWDKLRAVMVGIGLGIKARKKRLSRALRRHLKG